MIKSIIFIHRINETSTKSCGAFEKLLAQSESLSSFGYSITLVYMYLSTLRISKFINRKTKEIVYEIPNITIDNEGSLFWNACSHYFKNHSNVTFYLRYVPGSFDHEFIQFMEFIKLKNFLCLEFATYPLHLELENNIQESEKLFSSKSSLIPHLLISPSRIKDINGRQYFFLKHGYTAEPPNSFKEPSSEVKMLAVANISKWHGFDRLIKGLNSYVVLNNETKISLQIIGDGIFKNDLKNLVKNLNIDNFVKFIDYKTHEELVDYYLDSSIAISTLNLNRLNMSYAQPLKQANYLLHGLPIVSCLKTENEKIDIFNCIVPNDETTLDVQKLISFYKNIKIKFSRLDISKTAIRELSWNNFAQSFDIEIKKFFR